MKSFKILTVVLFLILSNSCQFFKPPSVRGSVGQEAYQPFSEKNKLVVLEEESNYKINSNLPILDGATALYPVYAAFAQAVYPEGEYFAKTYWVYPEGEYSIYYDFDVRVEIPPIVACSRTAEAFDNLIKGKVDIIFCAQPSADQIKSAEENGVIFNMTPIGKDAFVFFVNNRNPIYNITTEQIRGIYSGRITNWNELGGRGANIRAYQREKNSGDQTILELIMGGEKIMEPLTENKVSFMEAMVTGVADYRNYNNAIGFSFLFFTTQMVQNNELRLLSIDGITPSRKTIQNGTYPYSDYFYAITTNTQNENVNPFIEWMLSEQGQYLVEKTGYVPVK